MPNAETLAGFDTAFAGTVTSLDDATATLSVDQWYAGGDDAATVTVSAPSQDLQDLLMAVDFEEGTSYLVSADGEPGDPVRVHRRDEPRARGALRGGLRPVSPVVGLLLAAGSGERFGGPKALARDEDGTSWLLRSVVALKPCAEIVVVLGAEAEQAAALLPMSVARVRADDWAEGMGASLRTGLGALDPTAHDAALVSLVDLPDVDSRVVSRVLAAAVGPGRARPGVVRRRAGAPGADRERPLGRRHRGRDGRPRSARLPRRAGTSRLVECGDLAIGRRRRCPARLQRLTNVPVVA